MSNAGLMFGAPIGEVIGREQFRDDLSTGINAQYRLGQIAMQPLEARLHTVQAEKAELELQQNKQMAALMAQSMGAGDPEKQPGGSPSIASTFDNLARMAARSGLINQATKLATTAATIHARENAAESSLVTAALNRAKLSAEQANFMGRMFGDATSQEDWDQRNAAYTFMTGRQSPFAQIPFSENVAKQLREGALSVKERADLADKDATRTALANFRKRRLTQHDTEADIKRQRLKVSQAREERLAKNGGGSKGVTSPSTQELKEIKRTLAKDFPDLAAEDLGDAAFSLAAEARALRRSNPALDASQALNQALARAKQAGDFQTTKGAGLLSDTTRYNGGGKTAETPMAMPLDDGKVQVSKLTKGRFYINGKGQIGQWDGKVFKLAGNTRPLSPDKSRPVAAPAPTEDELDESGEDEEE